MMAGKKLIGRRKRWKGCVLGLISMALSFCLALGPVSALPVWAADAEIMKKLEEMQREIDALKAQVRRMGAEPAASAAPVAPVAQVPAPGGPQVAFGGQYRINGYIADNDQANTHDQEAARVRIRQNLDIKFDEQFKTHLQMELGHTTDNRDTTNNSNRSTNIAVRHAVLDYTSTNGINGQAGIVPLADYFGDTMFSSDWNYNPLALSITAPVGTAKFRVFAAKLNEGSETNIKDDFDHYQVDMVIPMAGKNQINAGGSLIRTSADVFGAGVMSRKSHYNYGIGAQFELAKDWMLNGFVLGSYTDKELLAAGASEGKGAALKLELTGPVGPGKFGIMATHAQGNSDGSGFLPVMALARTNGYWGYTGIMTVQGPTDTGFDGDTVNISNNGYGLTTAQAKYSFPIMKDLSGYVGVGWFGNSNTPGSRDEDVGTDAIVMGTYRFNKWLALDFGYAYAKLKDGVSGYSNGVLGGASFNDSVGERRDKSVFFSRLQAEF